MLAQRTRLIATSGTANARAAAATAAAGGKQIIDLTSGEIWADLAPAIRDGAIAAINRGENRYTDTIGLTKLRFKVAQALSSRTEIEWTADEVAITAGAKQALFDAAMVLLNPGDEVIVPSPYWTTFPAQVLLAGGKPVFVDSHDSGFVPRVQAIAAAITPATRAIIINTPNNPTGAVYDRSTLAGIAELAMARDLWVIYDECYAAFTYPPHEHSHILRVAPQMRNRTIVVNAFSKQLAMTGWRIGYLAGPAAVIKAAKALQSHTTSNPNVIAQHAVIAHLENSDGTYERALHARLVTARRLGLEILQSLDKVAAPRAEGGFYFYLDLAPLLQGGQSAEHPRDADDVVAALLAAGVAAVSGTAFGDPYGLRVSYGAPIEHLESGLRRLVDVLNAWQ
ncbi:MAG: aminotransferase class I/II-fold pyridoxal phosphate-dependent enzyme [Steroidobacteraceae bacterium]